MLITPSHVYHRRVRCIDVRYSALQPTPVQPTPVQRRPAFDAFIQRNSPHSSQPLTECSQHIGLSSGSLAQIVAALQCRHQPQRTHTPTHCEQPAPWTARPHGYY